MEDILFVMPWCCGNKDCPSQWHKSTYWGNFSKSGKRTTYTVDNYSDGDHESVLRKDLPSTKKVDQAWKEYHQYVAQTGKDPLDSFILPEPKKVEHSMQALVRQGSDRLILKGLRKRGKLSAWRLNDIPQYVREYLDLSRTAPWVLSDFKTLKELQRTCKKAGHGDRVVIRTPALLWAVVDFNVTETIPMSNKERVAFLKKAAAKLEV